MPLIKLNLFSGEFPKAPRHLLSDGAASSSLDCDFAYGELRGLAGLGAATNTAYGIKSIYTDDGRTFYYWDKQTEACKSQVVGDQHKRLYYTYGNGTDTRVVAMAGTYGQAPAGQMPTGYKLGVPAPDKPTIRALNYGAFDVNKVPVLLLAGNKYWYQLATGMTFDLLFFYEDGGTQYQQTPLTLDYYGTASGPRAVPQPYAEYADQPFPGDSANWINILGRNFHCIVPNRAGATETVVTTPIATPVAGEVAGTTTTVTTGSTTVVTLYETTATGLQKTVTTTTSSTPDTAKPVVFIQAKVGTQLYFSCYTDGSVSAAPNAEVTLPVRWLNGDPNTMILICRPVFRVVESRAYVRCYVNIFDEVSKPSDPVSIDLDAYQTVELSGEFTQPASYAPIKGSRSYCTGAQEAGNTDYYFNAQGDFFNNYVLPPGGVTSFRGAQPNKAKDLGEVITSTGWDLPPAGLTGLVSMSNGILAGFRDTRGTDWSGTGTGENEIWFCEPYKPHAWPAKYSIALPYNVVGIIAVGNSLIVTTTQHPYLITGVHPSAMSHEKLSARQAGVGRLLKNHRAMVDIGYGVVYASNDGLALVSGLTVNLDISERFFTREAWRTRFAVPTVARSIDGAQVSLLEDMKLAYYDGFLIGYFSDPANRGFVIRMDEAAGTFATASMAGLGHFNSVAKDALIIINQGTIKEFSAGSRQTYRWQSKQFIQEKPVNFGCLQAKVNGPAGASFTINVGGDKAAQSQAFTVTIPSDHNLIDYTYDTRMAAGFLTSVVDVAFENVPGTVTIKACFIATTMKELQNV